MGQERAFRLDTDGPLEDKVYLSIRRATPAGWQATTITPSLAKAVEEVLVAWLGPSVRGLRVDAVRGARQHVPIHIVQATLPWDGGSCQRLKTYHKIHTDLASAQRALRLQRRFAAPFDGTKSLEIYGRSWPDGDRYEAYTHAPWTDTLDPGVKARMEEAGGVACQTSLDTNGATTWYFSTNALDPDTALSVLQSLTSVPFSKRALHRVHQLLHAGWCWADLIVQSQPNGCMLPIAHMLHPHPHGRSFAI